jgi:hypothetical protein
VKADATKDPSHRRGEEAAAVAAAAEIGAVEIEEGPPDVGEAHRLPGDLKEIERKGSRAQSGHQSPQGPLREGTTRSGLQNRLTHLLEAEVG